MQNIKKLICDWTVKKKYLIHYRALKFHIRHGMVIDKVYEVISFKQSKWLEKQITFNTRKRNKTKAEIEKDFHKLINNGAFGKSLENVRNRLIIDFIKNCENKKNRLQQPKLPFNGIHKSHTNYSSYTFKQSEVVMDKPIFVDFAILELIKLHMYETYYDIMIHYNHNLDRKIYNYIVLTPME